MGGPDHLQARRDQAQGEDDAGDQKRFNTPEKAIENGADFIIVGRPIIKSIDKIGTVKNYLNRMKKKVSRK